MTSEEFAADEPGSTLWRIVQAVLGGLILLFSTGVLVGFFTAVAEKGLRHPERAVLVVIGMLAFMALGGWLLRRTIPHMFSGQLSPRTKRARTILYASMALGAVLGVVLQLGAFGADPDMLAEGPLPPVIAVTAIAIWLVGVPFLSWFWWKSIDEHEASAYKDGALVGIYVYSAIVPTWWLGWRGGYFSEPQEMVTFMIVLTAWGLTWMVRRFA